MPDEVVTEVALKSVKTNAVFTDKLRMFFIDLLSFKKEKEEDLENDLERWIYSVKNMGTMTKAPQLASDSKFSRLYTLSEIANMPPYERSQYEANLFHHWDNLSDKYTTKVRLKREREEGKAEGLQEGMLKGKAEGLQEGIEKGARNKAIAMARELKALGVSNEIIVISSGLSLEEIQNL